MDGTGSDQEERADQARRLASLAALSIDPRLADIWQVVWTLDDESGEEEPAYPRDTLAALLRLAYLQGYADAGSETDPGTFFRELGLRDPWITAPARVRRRRSDRARPDSSGT